MKYLKTYPVFESSGLTLEQEKFLNRYTKGTWSLNPEGIVDIEGDFNCMDFNGTGREIKTLYRVRFGKVSGHFSCSSNKLTTLEGAPQEVGGSFDCYKNQLTSLVGSPQKVSGNFYCSYNKLVTLDGAPQEVGGNFDCSYNQLTTLEGAPKKYKKIYWTEGDKNFEVLPIEGAIKSKSVLVWDLIPEKDRSNKLNDFIEEDPSRIDHLNVLFDREWYTPSPYVLAIYKAWKRGL